MQTWNFSLSLARPSPCTFVSITLQLLFLLSDENLCSHMMALGNSISSTIISLHIFTPQGYLEVGERNLSQFFLNPIWLHERIRGNVQHLLFWMAPNWICEEKFWLLTKNFSLSSAVHKSCQTEIKMWAFVSFGTNWNELLELLEILERKAKNSRVTESMSGAL